MSEPQTKMDCIIVGGCANGIVLQRIDLDAEFIELKRPDFIKPVETALQEAPEIIHEQDIYEVHPIALTNSESDDTFIFGIGVVAGQELTWAISELVKGYVENVTQKLIAAGLIDQH